jgi:putative DNA primase/helicase
LIVGRLVEHGPARYQFREDQALSYFMKLQTERGSRVLWGKDLPRALTSSQTKVAVGDVVGARRVGRESVTVLNQQRDAEGRVVSRHEQQAHRNQWVVEKTRFFTERARVARQLRDGQLDARETLRVAPELKDTFTTLHAAAELAAAKIQHPEDREKFMDLLRERLAQPVGFDSQRSQQGRAASNLPIPETGSMRSKPGRTR